MTDQIDFHILRLLNILARHKRQDVIATFFDESNLTYAIHTCVAKVFGVTMRQTNDLVAGKSSQQVFELVKQKLEDDAKKNNPLTRVGEK